MFNIRKSNGNIITKAITPSAKTGRQLAASLLENIKLQSQLEQSNSPDAVQSPVVQSPISVSQKVDLQKHLEQARITGHASKLIELDRKAKASQEGYSASSRFSIRNCKVGLGALNCPNQKTYDQILDDNTKLMSHGLKPYLTYESWVQASENESVGSKDVTWNKFVPPVLSGLSTAPAFIVKHSYYILYEAGVCYYLSSGMSVPSILKRASSENTSAAEVDNSSMLISCAHGTTWRNLTRQEYDSIVLNQPSQADLFKLFIQFVNEAGLQFDVSKAVPAWSSND